MTSFGARLEAVRADARDTPSTEVLEEEPDDEELALFLPMLSVSIFSNQVHGDFVFQV